MKFRNTIQLFGIIAGLVLAATPLHAAVVADPAPNDIFLAFRASGGTGAATSYIINLGQYSQFRNQEAGTTVSLGSIGNVGLDLVATFGSNWNTRGDVSWGVFGVFNSVNSSVFASREQSTPGLSSVPWTALDADGRNTTASAITSVLEGTNGFKGRQSTLNSTVAVIQPNTGEASSYNKQVATGGTNDFGSFSEWSSIEGDFGGGAAGTALDLYRIAATGVTNPGFFTIDNSGLVSFTAIPEPSAALIGAAGLTLLITNRRRQTIG